MKNTTKQWIGLALLLAFMGLLLFSRAMNRPLSHDEYQFVASAQLLAYGGYLPYLDYPYLHMPYLIAVNVLGVLISDADLLAVRAMNVAWGLGAALSIFMLVQRALRDDPPLAYLAALSAVVLYLNDPAYLAADGWALNHFQPALVSLLAFASFRWAIRPGRSWIWYALCGVLAGLATGMRLSYAVLIPIFALAVLVLPRRPLKDRAHSLLIFGLGAFLALLPVILLALAAPRQFFFGNYMYIRLNTLYRQLMDHGEAMSLPAKLGYFLRVIFFQPVVAFTYLAFLLFGSFATLRWFHSARRNTGGDASNPVGSAASDADSAAPGNSGGILSSTAGAGAARNTARDAASPAPGNSGSVLSSTAGAGAAGNAARDAASTAPGNSGSVLSSTAGAGAAGNAARDAASTAPGKSGSILPPTVGDGAASNAAASNAAASNAAASNAAAGAAAEMLLVAALGAALFLTAFAPTPTWPQYFFAPLPFLILGLAYGLSWLRRKSRVLSYGAIVLALALLAAGGAPQIMVADLQCLQNPSRWTTSQVHQLARDLRAVLPQGRVLTLAPIIPLEAGLDTYPAFATGPFAWRTAHLINSELRASFGLVSERQLADFLAQNPPDAILVGFERTNDGFIKLDTGGLERPLEEAAAGRGFRPRALPAGFVDEDVVLWIPD